MNESSTLLLFLHFWEIISEKFIQSDFTILHSFRFRSLRAHTTVKICQILAYDKFHFYFYSHWKLFYESLPKVISRVFTNEFLLIHIASVSGQYVHYIFKICQIVEGNKYDQ